MNLEGVNDMKLQPPPQLQPITKLSPTLLAILKQCPLKAGLRQAKAQQTLISSKAALLGTIVHRTLEKAGSIRGGSEKLREQAGAIWDKAVREMEAELRTSPLDKHLLPIQKWRKYYLLRERTIRRCQEIAANRGLSETQVIASERKFGGIREGFTGKPDLILRRPNGLVIIDYKSSELPDEFQAREEKIESWRQQILFYASIVNAELGEWPVGGEIRLLNKDVIPIPIDPQEAKVVAKEAQALKEKYNAKIEAGVSHSELAQYSVENCAFCEFKGACNTFWEKSPPPIPGDDEYGCLSGRILDITTVENKILRMVITSEKSDGTSQKWEITNLSTEQFENFGEFVEGDRVRLLDFAIESDSSYRAKPTHTSVMWEFPDGF